MAYTPAPFRRYLGAMADPNSATGGTNLDAIQGNALAGVTADTIDYPSGLIPDVTNVWPVKTAQLAWGEARISLEDLVTGNRAAPADLPFKVLPTFTFTADAHRYILEKIIKCALGFEAAVTGGVFEVDTLSLIGASAGTVVISFVWNGAKYTTAPVAYNAANSVLQTALRAATGPQGSAPLPTASITVTGGPLPAATTITMSGGMAGPVTGQTATPTGLTGGTVAYTSTTPGTAFSHPVSGRGFGTSQLPTMLFHLIEDAINRKMTGCAIESFEIVMSNSGVGTITVEAHPLYATQIDDSGSPTVPTGVNPEPFTQPMLARDMSVAFDGGSVRIGLSEFRFGWKNNSGYDHPVLGCCIEQRVLNGRTYKLWHPDYHRITGRQTVTIGYTLLDSAVADELSMQWSQIRAITANLVDPSGGSDAIGVSLYQAQMQDGGIGPLAATGELPSTYNGRAFYDPTAGSDALVTITNRSAAVL